MHISRRQLILASVTLAVIAGATTYAQSKSGQSVLKHIGVAGKPVRYTELAFVDPAMLPKHVYSPHAPLLVHFRVSNHEGTAVNYQWQVLVSQPRPHVASAGEVRLTPAAVANLGRVINVTCTGRTQVTVRLSTGEHVDYWADCVVTAPPQPPGGSQRSATRQRTRSRATAHP